MNVFKNIIVAILTILSIQVSVAQQTPAPPQAKPIVIMGATAHLGNGEVIENSIIAFDQGKITAVGNQALAQDFSNHQKIDATGKHIYPGFIAPNSQIGLVEIEAVRATRDSREIGYLKPHVRSIIAYSTDSRVTPTIRSNGVLLSQVVPQGGRISGQSSIVHLDAWNWEDAIYKIDDAIHLNWPSAFSYSGWWAEPGTIKANKNYEKNTREIETFFQEAKAYHKSTNRSKKNLLFDAMTGLFDGSKTLHVHTSYARSMMSAVLMAEKHGVKIVLVGAGEAWKITDFLKKHKTFVILSDVHSLPSRTDDDIDQVFKTPSILAKAGITFCFSMNGAWQQRNLPFQAGHAVGFGLDYEKAIKALTSDAAKILGIDKTTGSLVRGKDATLIIADGDALDMRTCKIQHAFIQGRKIDVDNKQKALARKFRKKYADQK